MSSFFIKFFNIKKNFLGVISLSFIVFVATASMLAYVLAPDNSSNANNMNLSIHSQKPGFSVDILKKKNTRIDPQSLHEILLFGVNETSDEIAVSDYYMQGDLIFYKEFKSFDESLKSVMRNDYVVEKKYFLFGTDKSGYYSGFVDKIIMWLINVTWSIPTLLLVIAITLALGKGFWQVFIAVGLTMWVEVARLVRGQVKILKERKFVVAAKVMGFGDFRIIMFHILPNIISPIIVISAANFAASILIESGLSFLGLGAQPPMISWGLMIKDHYNYIILGEPFLAIIPGICIMLLVTSFMLLGNSLRDILDVKN
jgi:ABC-type dipeptide/oligopeptide/nickel transport system permease subunit